MGNEFSASLDCCSSRDARQGTLVERGDNNSDRYDSKLSAHKGPDEMPATGGGNHGGSSLAAEMKEVLHGRRRKLASVEPAKSDGNASSAPRKKQDLLPIPGPDYLSKAFADSFGKECLAMVAQLNDRHMMKNPLKHPEEPYAYCFEETWDPVAPSRDHEGEALVQKIGQTLRKSGQQFEDPFFPADPSALFADVSQASANSNAKAGFRTDQAPFLAGIADIQARGRERESKRVRERERERERDNQSDKATHRCLPFSQVPGFFCGTSGDQS